MKLSELFRESGAQQLCGDDVEISDLTVDSRAVSSGSLFIARKGWYVDGHAYVAKAIESGAAALLVSEPREDWASWGVPVFFCPDEDPILGLIASRFYGHPTRALKVFGVTGTNGKTSAAWMLDALLRGCGETTALISTVAYRVGDRWRPAPNTTPDALVIQRLAREAVDAGATALVMEVSSHGAAIGRIAGTEFDALGFTNLTRDHLDFHGDEASYARAKALVFSLYGRLSALDGAKRPVNVFLDHDRGFRALASGAPELDASLQHLQGLADRVNASTTPFDAWDVRVGSSPMTACEQARANAIDVEVLASLGVKGTRVRIHAGTERIEGTIRAAGAFQVENAALAMTMVARVLGETRASFAHQLSLLSVFPGVPGRMELVADPHDEEPAVFVDYAHTPDAIRAILASARALDRPPLTMVIGCGGDRDRGKRPLMARAGREGADRLVLTSDNPRSEDPSLILDEVVAGLSYTTPADVVEVDRRRAIGRAIVGARGTVVVAGKGHETYEEVQGKRYHWDDRDEARAALAQQRFGLEAPRRLSGWSLEHLSFVTGGRVQATHRPLFRGLSTDTRTLKPGDLFVALKGENHDGHAHVSAALAMGAAAAIVERGGDWDGAVVQVESTERALADITRALIGEARRTRAGLETIAITGSNGKTTTRALSCAWVTLRDGVAPLSTVGNFNNQIGLPLSVASMEMAHRVAVLEMGASRAGDIAELVAMARPTVAVLTSIGPSHLEGFGSIDGVRRAKAEMVLHGRPQVVVLPVEEVDGIWGDAARSVGAELLSFGASEGDLIATRPDALGPVRLIGRNAWSGFDAEVPLTIPGRHNAGNLAASLLASSWHQGRLLAPPEAAIIAEFDRTLRPPPGRMERYQVGAHTVIFDAYNANPASTLAALSLLREASGFRVAVLGELFELGPDERSLHADVLAAAVEMADLVVAIGPRWGEGNGPKLQRFGDRAAAAAFIGEQTQDAATVLWKGSRGARLEEIRDAVEARWRQGAR